MGQISAKCGIACARGNNISWYYTVVNVYKTKTGTTDREKANLFIKSYANESRLTKNKWEDRPVELAHRKAVAKVCHSCENKQTGMCCPITMTELTTAISELKSKKSPGIDKISNEMLKHASDNAMPRSSC